MQLHQWAAVSLLIATGALAQSPEAFEVATIKPVGSNGYSVGLNVRPGGRIEVNGFDVKQLIATAYAVPYRDISGGEEWIEKDRYNIQAKPSDDAGITDLRHGLFDLSSPRLRAMLQSLLAERFQLRVRRESRQGDAYHLVRSGKPLLLKLSEVQAPTGENRDGASNIGWGGRWVIAQTTMPQLAKFAADYVVRAPVEDRTGLTGAFEYWEPRREGDPVEAEHTDRFLRLLSDIGLKLEKTKGTIETLVIEHAEKPSEN